MISYRLITLSADAELLNFFGGRMDDGTDGDTCQISTVIS